MTRLYLDIETARANNDHVFSNEEVIAIGVLEDWAPYDENSINKEASFIHFCLWDLGSEEKVIRDFYEYIFDLERKAEMLYIIGFNILRFDIPLLIQKGVLYLIGSHDKLNKFWYRNFTIDLMHAALPLNGMRFKGLSLENLAKRIEAELGYEAPNLYGSGHNVYEWYNMQKHDDILLHLKGDLETIRMIDLSKALLKLR